MLSSTTISFSDKDDSWVWKLCGSGIFSTKALTKLLMVSCFPLNPLNLVTLRNKLVHIKVGVFIWRARRNRIPVLFELDKRGIDLHSVLCPLCDKTIESVDHALFSCPKVRKIWEKIFKWWGINVASYGLISLEGLYRGETTFQCSVFGAKVWQAMVWTSFYLIWKIRNQKVFNKSCWSSPVALNEIQVKSFEWIAKRCKTKNIEWLDWLQNPSSLVV
ncbi:uncharacterized protein [Rutidosis leptorrhynchoides]|uniref:uncharacterized protein n=1 Tax=Rutidosis leptorrhynchoides TaxID=125765 RepID=UPI003A98E502